MTDTTATGTDSEDAARVKSLIEFAKGVLTARERVQMKMGDSQLGVFPQEKIEHLPGVFTSDDDGTWLRLRRQSESKPNAPVDYLKHFLDNDGSNPEKPPGLKPAISSIVSIEEASDLAEASLLRPDADSMITEKGITREDVVRITLHAEDLDAMRNAHQRWLKDVWMSWAEQERPIRHSIALYNALFTIHSAIHASEGAPPEVIWGFGIGLWALDGTTINMPLIEQEVEIEVLSGGDLIMTPRDRPMVLSLKPYLQLEVPNSARLQTKLTELLAQVRGGDAPVTPDDFKALEAILSTAATELHSAGRYLSGQDLPEGSARAEADLRVIDRWTIYVRPRSNAAAVQDLEQIAKRVERDGHAPAALKGFVAPEPDKSVVSDMFGLNSTALGATLAAPERSPGREKPEKGLAAPSEMSPEQRDKGAYFFPLPFNADQATIIDILEGRGKEKRSPVVSVTGPPGTGKSHTIANLICHAMARGQRVLVTARTAEAISVVRDKLPPSLQNLVIASTGTDRESIEHLKSAVSELSDEIVALDVAAANRRREELEQAILECDDIAEMADKELSGIARANLEQINMDGEAHTPMELAAPVNQGRALHGWFDDRPGKPPVADLSTSLEVLRRELPRLAPDLNLAGTQLPSAGDLPTVADIIAAHREETIRVARPNLDPNDFPPMAVNSTTDLQTARDLARRLDAIEQERSDLDDRQRALVEIAFGPDRDTLVSALQALNMMKMYSEGSAVRYGQDLPLDELIQAAERGAAGQKPAPGFLNRKLKAAVATVVIDGGIATTADHWRAVLDIMRLEAEIGQIRTVLGKVPPAQDCLKGITRGWEACEALIPLRKDMQMAIKLSDGLRMTTREAEVFFPVDMDFKTCHRGDTRQLRDAIEANAPTAGGPHPAIAKLSDLGSRGKHTVYARLDAMARALGTEDASPQDIIRERTELTQEIDRLSAVLGDIEIANTHLETLERAGAPAWARRLKAHPADAETLIPDTWRAAWDWAMFAGRLDAIVALGNGDKIRSRKTNATRRREKLMIDLIRVRTMLGLKGRMTSSVQRAMQAFTQAVSRVGRGTGKTAPRFRAAAQNAAKEVAVAAPVWIMPEHRIPEQLPPDLEAFDLVILDEASQSDVTAVAALARGRQVLVVGDEEQVSPSNVGIQRQKIDALRAEHLDGLPNADLIDENTSIFEITMRMYPESHVILREHFRCVAPIINFSAQFYNNRLIPLRIPLPSERFDPPLVDVFLDRAERIGQVNLSEARAIVEEIAVIVADPAHAHRDIGVVSLIGAEQAIEIEKRLLADDRIGPDVMRERRIICGDARTMQGQERSVVFLSMVATPDRVTAQTKKDTQRRLNVAMSRAQDRVYLMRSVRNSDLKPADLKLKVVQHFEDPMPEGSKISGIDLMDRCESGFEREVLGMLLDAGYRATPQKSAGKFRIDIVVEGAEDRRLAIELDGDAYHGPDRWADDMARQSALERAGWVFWRVFGSQWASEKDRWWEDLRNTLAAMEIEPIGSEAVNDNFVEYRAFGSVIGETADGTTDNAADEPNAETPIEPDENAATPSLGGAGDIDPSDDSPEIAAASASGGIDARSGGPADATEQAPEEDLAGIRPATSKPSLTSPAIPVVHAAQIPRSAGKDRTAEKSGSAKRDAGAGAIQADLFQTRIFGSVEISTGMVVKIEMDDGERREIVLVARNSDAGTGRILPSSPLGESLMGSVAGEDIEFMIGRDLRTARILSVETEEIARAG